MGRRDSRVFPRGWKTLNKKLNERIKKGREYRAVVNIAPSQEENSYVVEGYAATWECYELYNDGEYRILEQILPTALNGADLSDVILRFDHAGPVFARTSNGTLRISTDGHGIQIWADLSRTERARQMHEEIKTGMITKMSWAFTVTDDSWLEENGQSTRTIKQIGKVFDVAPVSIPANDGTEISARCLADGVIRRHDAEEVRRELDLSMAKIEFIQNER